MKRVNVISKSYFQLSVEHLLYNYVDFPSVLNQYYWSLNDIIMCVCVCALLRVCICSSIMSYIMSISDVIVLFVLFESTSNGRGPLSARSNHAWS